MSKPKWEWSCEIQTPETGIVEADDLGEAKMLAEEEVEQIGMPYTKIFVTKLPKDEEDE